MAARARRVRIVLGVGSRANTSPRGCCAPSNARWAWATAAVIRGRSTSAPNSVWEAMASAIRPIEAARSNGAPGAQVSASASVWLTITLP